MLILFAIALLSLSGASALEPLKVAIMNTNGSAVNVQVILNDYSSGTADTKYTGATQSLTPNGSGIIIANVDNNIGTDWDDITATEVNSYYVLDVLIDGTLYAQYRLDQLILSQSQTSVFDNDGNLSPATTGASDLGNDNNRWGELYITGNTLHIGPDGGMAGADELAFSYNDATNTATMTVAGVTALTAVNDNINIPQQATIDGLAIGQGGGNINTNTAIGLGALSSNTNGSGNTAIGQGALFSNIDGFYNTATGYSALYSNTTGTHNMANGTNTLFKNITGSSNTANGQSALYSNTSGSSNTANGQSALFLNISGDENTGLGYQAGYSLKTGNDNIFIGSNAGYNLSLQKVDAQNSMAIGAGTYTTADNQVVIGNSAITETQLRGKLQNNVTTAANTTALAGAVTSVINYTGSGAVTSGDLPTATDGTFLFVLCTNGGFNFLGQTVSSGEVVTCLRIGGTWYRVK